jgi:hypothetical protein
LIDAGDGLAIIIIEPARSRRVRPQSRWFAGKLVIEHTHTVFRTTDFPKMKWNQFLLTPYFGSGLLPHAQALWIDDLSGIRYETNKN